MIYFLKEKHKSNIKIGSSGRVNFRVKDLQTGNSEKLILIGSMPGGKKLESLLHRTFQDFRCEGGKDWFRPVPELVEFIRNNLAGEKDFHLKSIF